MAGRPRGTKMMDVGGRRVLCWVQTGLPVKRQSLPPVTLTTGAEVALPAARVTSLEKYLKALQGEHVQKEKALGTLTERVLSLEWQGQALEAKMLSLQGEFADVKRADLPLEVLKMMHSALFETSGRYRSFLKESKVKLPRWADDREVLDT